MCVTYRRAGHVKGERYLDEGINHRYPLSETISHNALLGFWEA